MWTGLEIVSYFPHFVEWDSIQLIDIILVETHQQFLIFSHLGIHAYSWNLIPNALYRERFSSTQVLATDPDEGPAGDVKYSIIGTDIENTFRLDANSGILYPYASLLGLDGELGGVFAFHKRTVPWVTFVVCLA